MPVRPSALPTGGLPACPPARQGRCRRSLRRRTAQAVRKGCGLGEQEAGREGAVRRTHGGWGWCDLRPERAGCGGPKRRGGGDRLITEEGLASLLSFPSFTPRLSSCTTHATPLNFTMVSLAFAHLGTPGSLLTLIARRSYPDLPTYPSPGHVTASPVRSPPARPCTTTPAYSAVILVRPTTSYRPLARAGIL